MNVAKITRFLKSSEGRQFSVCFRRRAPKCAGCNRTEKPSAKTCNRCGGALEENRTMRCRLGVRKFLKGGEWADGNAGTPKEHDLLVVFDMELYQQLLDEMRIAGREIDEAARKAAGEKSYRSIPLDMILWCQVDGEEMEVLQ